MPQTELVWNVRLLSTAGKAFYTRFLPLCSHFSNGIIVQLGLLRNRYKQMTLKIELSSKVVDCDERVRHTLAHEMCHLAVWVLDNDPHERGHGPQFKTWAARVTKARPEIVISTKHTYEINYKFNWECVECGKVYGRHSNSINVEKSACGVCNPPGRLKPLFEKRTRRTANSMTSGSKLAAGSPRESPRAHNHPPRSPEKSPMKPKTVAATSQRWYPGPEVDLSDQDDVNELIKGFATVSLKGGK
ncbi:hypothetical protein K439DRAFT_1384518 [Ramaria rubella]|nr:hypothetical protein K439DRAFT_1384518 [Ramaria rubella]